MSFRRALPFCLILALSLIATWWFVSGRSAKSLYKPTVLDVEMGIKPSIDLMPNGLEEREFEGRKLVALDSIERDRLIESHSASPLQEGRSHGECSIVGELSLDLSFQFDPIEIVLESILESTTPKRVVPQASISASGTGEALLVAWESEGLQPGFYRITYQGRHIQEVELFSGVNSVHANWTARYSTQIVFLDLKTGLPVQVRRLTWASSNGIGLSNTFTRSIGPDNQVHNVGTSVEISEIRGPVITVAIYADSYRTKMVELSSQEATHFVDLEPLTRFTLSFVDSGGLSVNPPDPSIGKGFRLAFAYEKFKAVQWGMNSEGAYVEFDQDLNGDQSTLIPPAGYQLIEILPKISGERSSFLAKVARF